MPGHRLSNGEVDFIRTEAPSGHYLTVSDQYFVEGGEGLRTEGGESLQAENGADIQPE